MQKLAVGLDHRDFALPTGATAAKRWRFYACPLKRFEQGLMLADSNSLAGLGEAHLERVARRWTREAFEMDILSRPTQRFARVDCAIYKALWAANIEMRPQRLPLQQGFEIDPLT